jgi:DnaJ family protein C protein 19
MGTSLILAGLGMAALGFAGRYALRAMPQATKNMEEMLKTMPAIDAKTWANSKYHRGGFDPKMNKRFENLVHTYCIGI